MPDLLNIYCDESCHLEHDRQKVMVIGGVWCPKNEVRTITEEINYIKTRHGFNSHFEIKWGKVSPQRLQFYLDIIEYFWNKPSLHFRAIIIPDKTILNHEAYRQTHDDWYYKMYFSMLKTIINPRMHYNIYIDIKDTRGGAKIKKLHEVLANAHYDFSRSIIHDIQIVRSHEVSVMQLTDLLIGAVSYANRELKSSIAKFSVVARLMKLSGYSLRQSTLFAEGKLNLFVWKPKEQQP
jgi:hypothetical protein